MNVYAIHGIPTGYTVAGIKEAVELLIDAGRRDLAGQVALLLCTKNPVAPRLDLGEEAAR